MNLTAILTKNNVIMEEPQDWPIRHNTHTHTHTHTQIHSRTSTDTDNELGGVTKIDQRNGTTSKKIDDYVFLLLSALYLLYLFFDIVK